METEAFKHAYNKLNKAQKEAVDTIEGPVMVIAGPGTGKTQILTLRIANILRKTDVGPENILALTFTESGARAMRERLVSYIGTSAYRVAIYTFHEFAGNLIRQFPDAYERAVGGRPMSDLEKVTILESILDTPTFKLLRPHGNPQFYIPHIMSSLSLMKREYITPDRFVEIIAAQEAVLNETPRIHEKGAHKGKVRSEYIEREKNLGKNKELLQIFRMYETVLSEQHLFDYDDMIFETVHALENNEEMLRTLQERYQYIHADEHQDVNGSQNKILELLASFHDRPNIFVVGDEKQSIYRFQGASLENFLYFEEKFSHAKTIALTDNYRSAQSILDCAHALITAIPSPAEALRVPLTAIKNDKGIRELRLFPHEAIEHDWLVESIGNRIASGVPKEEIAVIVRTNREVEAISTHLRKKGIPASASAESDILEHPITTSIRTLIRAVIEPEREEHLFELLHGGYLALTVQEIITIMGARSIEKKLNIIIQDTDFLESIGIQKTEKITRVASILAEAHARMSIEAPHRVLEYLLREMGFIDHVLSYDPHEGVRVIRRVYDEIESLVRQGKAKTLFDIERMFRAYIEHGIPLSAPYVVLRESEVQVMTAHKAKGLEFECVYIPHLTDQGWGGRVRPNYFDIPVTEHIQASDFDREDDERKLLYVAMTRAKLELYMSSSETNSDGKALMPTRLLESMQEDYFSIVDTDPFVATFEAHASLQTNVKKVVLDTEMLRTTLRNRGLSATSLNNYLRDPWNYLYRNVLRVPEVQSTSALFGTALHDTLEKIFLHKRKTEHLPSMSEVTAYLEQQLMRMPITDTEYTRLHERAFTALSSYLGHIEKVLPYETKEEYKVEAILPTEDPVFPQVRLTGMLDRLDFDAEGRLLRVVDYKTGKPKTRGYIEGKTKDSNGDYKRQLTFYALLLSLQDDERLHTREGLLSFIEADEKGVIHEEAYSITDEEIEALKQEIIRVVHEIAHGTFLEMPCDPNTCDYCPLVEKLRIL